MYVFAARTGLVIGTRIASAVIGYGVGTAAGRHVSKKLRKKRNAKKES